MFFRHTRIITGVLAAALALLPISPGIAATPTIASLRQDAQRECSSLQSKMNDIVFGLANDRDYERIAADRPALKTLLVTNAGTKKTALDSWCSAMAGSEFPSLAAAQMKFNELGTVILIEENVIPAFKQAKALENILDDYRAFKLDVENPPNDGLVKDYTDFSSVAPHDSDAIISTAKSAAQAQMTAATSALPADALFTTAITGTATASASAVATIEANIKAIKDAVKEGKKQYKTARKGLDKKLEYAALYLGTSSTGKSAHYGEIAQRAYDVINRTKSSESRSYANGARRSDGLLASINATTYFSSITKSDMAADANRFRTELAAAKTYMDHPDTDTMQEIETRQTQVVGLKYKNVTKAMKTMLSWHKDLKTMQGATAANSDAEDGLNDMLASMQNTDKNTAITTALGAGALSSVTQILGTVNLTQFTDDQTLITVQSAKVFNPQTGESGPIISSTSSESSDKLLVNELKRLVRDYGRAVSTERKKLRDARSKYLEIVKNAAASGQISNLAPFADDLKAQKLFDQFNSRRQTFYDKAGSLVNKRKSAIQKNNDKILSYSTIPTAAQIGGNLQTYTTAINGQLDTHATQAAAITDYYALKEHVQNIKLIGVSSVFLPGQRQYAKAAKLFSRQQLLSQILVVLQARVNALPSGAEKTALASEASSLAGLITGAGTSLTTALTGSLNQAFTQRAAGQLPTAEDFLTDAEDEISVVNSDLKEFTRSTSSLLRDIRAAESQ